MFRDIVFSFVSMWCRILCKDTLLCLHVISWKLKGKRHNGLLSSFFLCLCTTPNPLSPHKPNTRPPFPIPFKINHFIHLHLIIIFQRTVWKKGAIFLLERPHKPKQHTLSFYLNVLLIKSTNRVIRAKSFPNPLLVLGSLFWSFLVHWVLGLFHSCLIFFYKVSFF